MHKHEHITPKNEEHWLALRRLDITSTDVAALFGLSPYKTPFELWHSKRPDFVDTFVETPRVKWGTRLQDAIAFGVADDEGWTVRRRNVYSRIPSLRLGASFDFEILAHPNGPAVLEVKNVDGLQFRDNWTEEDGVLAAPAHIELQLQAQLLASGRSWGVIVALVGGNDPKVVTRQADQEVHTSIANAVTQFWRDQEAGKAPDPDWIADSRTLRQLHSKVDAGYTITDCTAELAELVRQYQQLSSEVKSLEALKEGYRNQILAHIGSAEKVIGAGWSITASTIEERVVPEHVRSAYRGFRVTKKA